ncbi:MAG: substrate-binding domain-containing protein [Prevotella sp.]|nr:substrate-binding domain-containing protein [Prevotella sp.]MBQ8714687.1 substrate-binding domain-containing protein [Prevotella sp.]
MRNFWAYLIVIVVGSTLLTSCSEREKTYKIGVAQCSKGPWREKVNQEMLGAQHLYEYDVKVDIANSYDDPHLQAHQIDSLAQTDIDLMVVAPYEDTQVINEAIARVLKAGIPVVSFDRKTSADYTAFIGGNNIEAGYIVGQYIASLVKGKSHHTTSKKPLVMEITGLLSSTPALERHQGFEKAMKALPEVEYICRKSDWSSDSSCRLATELIDSLRRSDIGQLDHTFIFCHNDGMATGVYKAVVEQDVEGRVKILGIDGMPHEGLEYVALGHQIGTYYYPTHGERIIRLAIDILTGKPYERENPMLGFVVTPDNVDLVTTESTELMRQNDHMVTIQDKLEDYLGLYNTQRKALWASLVLIVLLVIAVITIWRAYILTRRAIRQRQALNEEETLFYTNADNRTLRQVFEMPQEQLPPVRSQDTIFAETLNEAIRQNMSNPNLKMEDLGETVGLSRVQLYRKVKAITGLSPVELLRKIRLQHGYVLLSTTTKTIQEIAFEVGFNTPAYFSKCFREQYGKYPSELRELTN